MVVGIQESHSECNQREAREEVQSEELKESLQKNKSNAKVCSSLTIKEELERDKKVQELINGSRDTTVWTNQLLVLTSSRWNKLTERFTIKRAENDLHVYNMCTEKNSRFTIFKHVKKIALKWMKLYTLFHMCLYKLILRLKWMTWKKMYVFFLSCKEIKTWASAWRYIMQIRKFNVSLDRVIQAGGNIGIFSRDYRNKHRDSFESCLGRNAWGFSWIGEQTSNR